MRLKLCRYAWLKRIWLIRPIDRSGSLYVYWITFIFNLPANRYFRQKSSMEWNISQIFNSIGITSIWWKRMTNICEVASRKARLYVTDWFVPNEICIEENKTKLRKTLVSKCNVVLNTWIWIWIHIMRSDYGLSWWLDAKLVVDLCPTRQSQSWTSRRSVRYKLTAIIEQSFQSTESSWWVDEYHITFSVCKIV